MLTNEEVDAALAQYPPNSNDAVRVLGGIIRSQQKTITSMRNVVRDMFRRNEKFGKALLVLAQQFDNAAPQAASNTPTDETMDGDAQAPTPAPRSRNAGGPSLAEARAIADSKDEDAINDLMDAAIRAQAASKGEDDAAKVQAPLTSADYNPALEAQQLAQQEAQRGQQTMSAADQIAAALAAQEAELAKSQAKSTKPKNGKSASAST
jgi:hypothetical protein